MRIVTYSRLRLDSMLGAAAFVLLAVSLNAQQPEARITREIDSIERTTLKGSHSPLARPEYEVGRVPSATRLEGISIVFSRTAAQEADLQALIASQQDPSSSMYQQWLTPEQFGSRFGLADADITAVESWLRQQGFTVDSVSRSRNQIMFSGTVQQAEQAFGTELHYYSVNGERHFAPHSDLMLPASLTPVVQAVTNLSTFRPKSHVKRKGPQPATESHFTSSQTGDYFLTPKDVATIYDINPAYSAGMNGTGQSIAVLGQSEIVMTDIEHFQTAAGFTVKDPTRLLVTGSGTATIVTGDESESDLDLEYAGAMAPGATIFFVYTGNNSNFNVWNSLQYAIQNNVAPIVSMSYGLCESQLGQTSYNSLNNTLAQAATQGQTVVAASGDAGSADCVGTGGVTAAQQLAVDFPASSQYATGIGGSEFPTADVDPTNSASAQYWQARSGTDIISSALKYIPEIAWNESTSGNLSAGGGGISTFTARPSWQTGVSGIPAGTMRLVPDISLSASPNNAGYLYCSSDSTTNVTGSCSHGFRDTNNTNLTVAGGTSFGAPIFAGMMAIVNQKMGAAQGLANTKLYSLADNSTTYASVFHDLTSGNNNCSLAGPTVCPTTSPAFSKYSAGMGYDLATGLGSIDFNNLLTAWSGSTSLAASKTTVTAAASSVASGANDVITITVASNSSSSTTTPTGTVSVSVDSTTVKPSLALAAGVATYTFSSTTGGSHTISATYSGDTTYSSSMGSATVTVTASTKSFTLTASNLTVAAGNTGSSALTVKPENGYTGTVKWAVSSNASTANVCFSIANTPVTGTSEVTASLTVKTTSSACGTTGMIRPVGRERYAGPTLPAFTKATARLGSFRSVPAVGMFAVFLWLALGRRRPRGLRLAACALLVMSAGLIVSGCASSSTSSGSSTTAAKGTYTVTITGTDTTTSSITATTSMTLTID